jgi:small-conductance mechanosensitive channel
MEKTSDAKLTMTGLLATPVILIFSTSNALFLGNQTEFNYDISLYIPILFAVIAVWIVAAILSDEARMLDDPAPSIIFSGFGESSLDLVSRFYIGSIDQLWPVKTGFHLEVYRRFEAAGIVISFPQRDVHLDSEQPLRIAIDPRPTRE